ncbi:hypothetical protein IPM19_00305 [bacterium]|nr:MAG: hypothetical protein IPM19_00305 [bacterium]
MLGRLIFLIAMSFALAGITNYSYAQASPTPTPSPTATVAASPSPSPTATPVKNNTGYPIWKTITIGNFKTKSELLAALQKAGVTALSSNLIEGNSFALSAEPVQINLVRVKVKDFQIDRYGAYRKEFFAKALSKGLALCPLEVGPQLRLQYTGQPNNELLRVASEPIMDAGYLNFFSLEQWPGFKPWLYARNRRPTEDFWYDEDEWVFMLPPPIKKVLENK